MKKIEVELNDFCPIDCPYLDIVGGQIWKDGEREPRPRSYGLKYSCKNMSLCQCVVGQNKRPQDVIVEINGSLSGTNSSNYLDHAHKTYLCPSCNFQLMREIWNRELTKCIDVYSSIFYDGRRKRPKFCPKCGKELIYPSDCILDE